MQEIMNSLARPEWWFTALFMGVVAAAITPQITRLLSWAASRSSSTARQYMLTLSKRREDRVARYASDGTLLIIVFIRAYTMTLASLGILFFAFTMLAIRQTTPAIFSANVVVSNWWSTGAGALLLALSAFCSFRSTMTLRLAHDAYFQYTVLRLEMRLKALESALDHSSKTIVVSGD
jgi:hypothetical protein